MKATNDSNTTNNTATPTPWKQGTQPENGNAGWTKLISDDGTIVAKILPIHKQGERQNHDFDIEQANAALIVTAVNSHAALVEMLSDIVKSHDVGMGSKAKKLRVDIARDYIATLILEGYTGGEVCQEEDEENDG